MSDQKDQLRRNGGVMLQGRCRIQILDSYQNPTYANCAGSALCGQSAPLVNTSRPAGEWQTYDSVFHPPCCAPDDSVQTPGSLTPLHNGVFVRDQAPGRGRGCVEEGSLALHDHEVIPLATAVGYAGWPQ